jgi:rhamnosyltransferase
MFNDTCAVIVTYNPNLTEVKTLIERISKHVALILIVDNGSENVIELRPLSAHVVELGENRGVATAQNIGIRMALERDYQFVLLFDHDSLPDEDMVPRLREAFDALSKQGVRVAAVGANYIERNGGAIQEPSRRTGWAAKDMIISSGGLFSAEALRDVGPMLDDLFIDYIDTEWCMRARRKWREHNYRVETQCCWKIYMVRDAIMGHTWSAGITRVWAGALSGGLVLGAIAAALVPRDFAPVAALFMMVVLLGAGFRRFPVYSPIRQYYLCRNAVHLYLRSPYPWSWKAKDAISRAVIFLVALLGGFPGGRWQYVRMMLLGAWHGARGRLGPLSTGKAMVRGEVRPADLVAPDHNVAATTLTDMPNELTYRHDRGGYDRRLTDTPNALTYRHDRSGFDRRRVSLAHLQARRPRP